MAKKHRRSPRPPQPKKAVDLSKVDTDTSATRAIPGLTETDSTAGDGSQFTNEMSTDEFLGHIDYRRGPTFTIDEIWKVIGLVVIVAGVVGAGLYLTFGISRVEEKVDTVGEKVNILQAISSRNEVKLDGLSSAVTEIGREVSKTKDLVNESRVEQAEQKP